MKRTYYFLLICWTVSIITINLYQSLLSNHPENIGFSPDNTLKIKSWIISGNPICNLGGHQEEARLFSDGVGGGIITWEDRRGGIYFDIYAQRINNRGESQWIANGISVCNANNDQTHPELTVTNKQEAIITWRDKRDETYYDIYAQKLNSNGVPQWSGNGVTICARSFNQDEPVICSDGANGAIIAWRDDRSGSDFDIYAQRINGSGDAQWTPNGVNICNGSQVSNWVELCADGSGGAILTWLDNRTGNYKVYAQRVNASGIPQWIPNGVPLLSSNYPCDRPKICGDDTGGAFIVWDDSRKAGNLDIYMQHINSTGNCDWDIDGKPICTMDGTQQIPRLACDNFGNIIACWMDARSGNFDIYAQKLNLVGNYQWAGNGTAVCTASGDQWYSKVCSDGFNGVIFAWQDGRGPDINIYAQRFNSDGTFLWDYNGLAICLATNMQTVPEICSGYQYAIITWDDYRNTGSTLTDIYCRITDVDPPSNFSIYAPTGWIDNQTPSIICRFYEGSSGINISAIQYAYSTTGDLAPSNWVAVDGVYNDAACSDPALQGDTGWLYLKAVAVPFNQDSEILNTIRFRSTDLANNQGIQNASTIKIDTSISNPFDFIFYLLLFIIVASVGAVGSTMYYKYKISPIRQREKLLSKVSTQSKPKTIWGGQTETEINRKIEDLIAKGISIDLISKLKDQALNEYFAQEFDIIPQGIEAELRKLGISDEDVKSIMEEFNKIPQKKRKKFLSTNLSE